MSDGARRYPVGAELLGDSVHFRVHAATHPTVDLVVDGRVITMTREDNGYFSAVAPVGAGARYGFRLLDRDLPYPDPASRWQPDGPEALSAVVDLSEHEWQDATWAGISLPGQVLYELHIGTYTQAGTWAAAEAHLPRLRDLGITVMQMMPVSEFGGTFGWGYDGVSWFAPQHSYGTPHDLQHFVDAAHQHGLAVILDVVYNHLGPAGNFLPRFNPHCFSARPSEWGEGLNFDDEHSGPMRELVLSNVAYWIREFHFDGFRLDATQQIFDTSPEHLLRAVTRVARDTAAPRQVVVVAENEPQDSRLFHSPDEDGYGIDGLFNEDFHHSCRVALTGTREAYLSDYRGVSREWLAAAQSGFLFQGQYYPWQTARRGSPSLDRPMWQFICFLENHDQVANSGMGLRLADLSSPSWWRALSALLLLGPWTPLLFQGQEWGARKPFTYFSDHSAELQAAVLKGRREFMGQFTRLECLGPASLDAVGAPAFASAKLDHQFNLAEERMWQMHHDLLALRRNDPSLGQHAQRLAGATVDEHALVLRYIGTSADNDRLVVVNLEPDTNVAAIAEPLLAPPAAHAWKVLWCSEDPKYGGGGVVRTVSPASTVATGYATTVFAPAPLET